MIKDAIESLYFDKCNIYEYKKITDSVTHQATGYENKVFENLPCRLTYKIIYANINENGAASKSQQAKLLISSEYKIKPGSKIILTKQTGQTTEYKASGEPAYYPSHQEIMLELFERWA